MRRAAKPAPKKAPAPRTAARASQAVQPAAWIDAEQGLAFTTSVNRRLREALTLRAVPPKRPGRTPKAPHARGPA
jgi:hypothetical protein